MPEGHTIHRLARDLTNSFRGQKVQASSPQGRFDAGAAKLDTHVCEAFEAHGKHLLGHFSSGDVLHIHLGLIGKFRKAKGDPVGAVRLRLATDDVNWDLRGPMVCDLGTPELADAVAASIGPDPLRSDADADKFVAAMKRRRIAVGAALLDQKVIAGVGNVYRAELLFIAGIDPETPGNALDETELHQLWDLTTKQLRRGEKLNRIVTVDPALGGFKTVRSIPTGERLYAYKRQDEPCRVCDTPIEMLEVAGRKIWRCPDCQRSGTAPKKKKKAAARARKK